MNDLSDTEKKIIHLLREDAKKSYAQMAKELGLSRQAVAYNVSALQKRGLIKRFTIDVDHEKMGVGLPIIILIRGRHVNIGVFKDIMRSQALKDDDRVEEVFTLSGEYSFGIIGWWQNKEDYGRWKTGFIEHMPQGLDYIMEELVIWDFYKHRGLFKIPGHIKGSP